MTGFNIAESLPGIMQAIDSAVGTSKISVHYDTAATALRDSWYGVFNPEHSLCMTAYEFNRQFDPDSYEIEMLFCKDPVRVTVTPVYPARLKDQSFAIAYEDMRGLRLKADAIKDALDAYFAGGKNDG